MFLIACVQTPPPPPIFTEGRGGFCTQALFLSERFQIWPDQCGQHSISSLISFLSIKLNVCAIKTVLNYFNAYLQVQWILSRQLASPPPRWVLPLLNNYLHIKKLIHCSIALCLVPGLDLSYWSKNEPCRDKTSTVKLITVVKCDNDACSSIHGFRASDIDC